MSLPEIPSPFDPQQNANYGPRPRFGGQSNGAALLDRVATFIRRFVAVSNAQKVALSLWVTHTHSFNCTDCTPYMAITSAEKQSGKTRLLEVLEMLVANAWLTGQVTAAVLARKIGSDLPPTLLLDESDAAFNGEKEYVEALRGVLNTGYRKGGKYSRCVGQGHEVRDFSSFCPKAIAGIGKLPDTVADRSIPIRLKRAARNEGVARFRRREVEGEATQLREELLVWCSSLDSSLCDTCPKLPDELTDRKQDVVEPLLAIAQAAGGEWPIQARQALIELCAEARASDDSIGVKLLSDIHGIFEERQADRISSEELATALAGIETSPWGEWSHGKPITKYKLAQLLKRFGIVPDGIRLPDGKTPRGYHKEDFRDSWERYLPSNSPESPHTPLSKCNSATDRINTSDSAGFASATSQSCCDPEIREIPNKNAPSCVVALPNQGKGVRETEEGL
jgi:hypothetical protein